MVWIRDPDTSQHVYGVGSANARDALRSNDRMLGQLRAKLQQLGQDATTDIIVVSDHGHNNVAGSSKLFPLRAVQDGEIGSTDPNGYSVSGLVRLADLMHRAGFVVFDGIGCSYLPVSFGIKTDGTPVYPVEIDVDGSLCGKAGQKYNITSFKVPAALPPNALVIAVNGGSDYIYVPDRNGPTVTKAVAFLQTRSEVGAIFVDNRYGDIPGTLPLNLIRVENTAGRNPDIIVSYDYDASAMVGGLAGTEYSGSLLNNPYRGMHGSFSPFDVHNTLIADGPDFREGIKDTLPTGNVDVAPTVASILGLILPHADGRPLSEALRNGPSMSDYQVASRTLQPSASATGISVSCQPIRAAATLIRRRARTQSSCRSSRSATRAGPAPISITPRPSGNETILPGVVRGVALHCAGDARSSVRCFVDMGGGLSNPVRAAARVFSRPLYRRIQSSPRIASLA